MFSLFFVCLYQLSAVYKVDVGWFSRTISFFHSLTMMLNRQMCLLLSILLAVCSLVTSSVEEERQGGSNLFGALRQFFNIYFRRRPTRPTPVLVLPTVNPPPPSVPDEIPFFEDQTALQTEQQLIQLVSSQPEESSQIPIQANGAIAYNLPTTVVSTAYVTQHFQFGFMPVRPILRKSSTIVLS